MAGNENDEGGDYHHGALAHPHDGEERGNIRVANMVHAAGETALVTCGTTKGSFVARLHRDWAPHGYDRATALFRRGYYDNSHFFRVVPNFIVQFGISYTTDQSLVQFANTQIQDDPQLEPKVPFARGIMSYAGNGPNSRTSQLFISYAPNPGLGGELWEVPFGEVIEGMDHVEALYSYGDMPPWGKGPVQQNIRADPNYIPNEFPLLDKFGTCSVEIRKPTATATDAANVAAAAAAAEEEGRKKDNFPKTAANPRGVEAGNSNPNDNNNADRRIAEQVPAAAGDDPVEAEQREVGSPKLGGKLGGALKGNLAGGNLAPFDDLMQVGAVVAGVIVVVAIFASLSRRKSKKKKRSE